MSFSKRAFDLVISIPLAIALAPIMLIIALLIRLDSPGPALFRQERLGLGKQGFTIYKFRTMYHRKDNVIDQFKEPVIEEGEDPRITRIGRILRRTSLDELPQLLNVLKGDMSLVGPRPLLPEQLRAIPEEYKTRFAAAPGITGLAQVRGRRGLNWLEQLQYDADYAAAPNIGEDIKLILSTVKVIFTGSGVYGTQSDNWRNYVGGPS